MAVFKMPVEVYRELKRHGVTDKKIAKVNGLKEEGLASWKTRHGIYAKVTKLSDSDIVLIRQLYFNNQGNQRELAERFNVSKSYIHDIVSGKRKGNVS